MHTDWEMLSVGLKVRDIQVELFSRQLFICIYSYHAPVNYEGTWKYRNQLRHRNLISYFNRVQYR